MLLSSCLPLINYFYLSNKHGEHAPEEDSTISTCTSSSNDERKDSPTSAELPLAPETPSSQQLLVPVILHTECLSRSPTDAHVNVSQSSASTSITSPVVVSNALDEQAADEELESFLVTHEP